jgi:hypothetical protein
LASNFFGFDISLSQRFDVPTIAKTAELTVRYQDGEVKNDLSEKITIQ